MIGATGIIFEAGISIGFAVTKVENEGAFGLATSTVFGAVTGTEAITGL
jgi:hypothetical protein